MLRMGNSVKSISELNQIKLKQFSVRVRRIQKIIRIYKIDLKVITFSPVNIFLFNNTVNVWGI